MEKLFNELNVYLADLNVLYRKVQNYHWNIKGKQFFILHAKLEEFYDGLNEAIDEVAEKILMLEGQPLGTMKDYLAVTKITEAENKKIDVDSVLKAVTKDFTYMLDGAKTLKKLADEKEVFIISAYMDELIDNFSKSVWMLKQTQE